MDIKEYSLRVKLLADLRNGGSIFNGSHEHASVIAENLFRIAKHHVRILSGDLDARVYGSPNVVQRAQEFLGYSDHKLDILVESNLLNDSHPFLRALSGSKNVSIKLIDRALSEGIPYHFMTADEDCFRFEEQKGTHKAVAAFGDIATQNLIGIFSKIEPHSTNLNVTAQ